MITKKTCKITQHAIKEVRTQFESINPDQMSQIMLSDQCLHCLINNKNPIMSC